MEIVDVVGKVVDSMRNGILKFSKIYRQNPQQVQIVFFIDQQKKLAFVTCVKKDPKETVKLKHIIGANWYNFMVKDHIKDILIRISGKYKLSIDDTNIMAGINNDQSVYLCVRNNQEEIHRINDPSELMEK